jgi:glycosyltransferase involved in cell wall biosynthesis
MRLLQVSRSPSAHDERFAHAWRSVGVTVSSVHTSDRDRADALSHLRTVLEQGPPDVVQAGPLSDVAPLVCEAWDGPLIAVSWGFDLMDDARDPLVRKRIQDVLAHADHLLVDNDGPLRIARDLGADPARITSLPWGVDLQRFYPGRSSLREELGWLNGEFVMLSSRRHEAIYDVETTARGFAVAARRLPLLRGLFCGGGSHTPQIQGILAEAGVLERCRFLGEIPAGSLPDVYRAADLYVSSSLVDGTSVSMLEAMATRVPTCVSAIEGNAQWIADGRGRSFAPGAADELGSAIVQMSVDAGGARAMANAAYEFVRIHADWSQAGPRLLGVARAAIQERAG